MSMATDKTFDVIVIGLGVMGSATAYHLSADGYRVLALEQFELDHNRGSSNGESRIIRYAYDHPAYVEMAKAVFPMWRALEAECGEQLMVRTGGLDFGPADSPTLVATRDNLRAAGVPYEWLTPEEVSRQLPQFRLDEGMMGGYQPDAGYLAASRCVVAQAKMAQKHGATLLPNTPVQKIDVLADSVRVHTSSAVYEAGRLVITVGPWASSVLGTLGLNLPLQATREELVFFEPPNMAQFLPEQFPVFIYHGKPWFYGLPSVTGTGLKVAVHGRNEPTDPDTIRRTPDEDYIEQVRAFVRRHLPQGDGRVREARICMYTMTPDEHFIIDRHPAHVHVVIGAGFSGHGFKFGILVGRILADLAVHGQTAHDVRLFSLSRFANAVPPGAHR